MRAGKLRQLIDIEQYSETQDGTGDPVKGWTTFVSAVPASIEPMSGRETFTSQQVLSSTTHAVRTRYFAGVTSKMRVKFGVRYFRINDVRNVDERGRELDLQCVEIEGGINE